MLAVPNLVGSATDFAVTVNVPAVAPAVYNPADVIVPPLADQVTAVLLLPVTVAVNCLVCPGCSVALGGATVTAIGCIVTGTVKNLVGSATEVAVTEKLPEARPAV